jgi:hypothetical protein
MPKFYLALVAAGVFAASALPAAAQSPTANSGVTNTPAATVQLSARRYHH